MSKPTRPQLAVISPNAQRREQILRRRLPKPIITVQQRSQLRLQELLSNCFSASDDHFFDLAKQALQQEDQDGYFCAMRELRAKRSKVFETFFDGLEQSFLALADIDELRPSGDAFAAASIDQLAIVGNDDLDKLVAKEAMVNRSFNQYKTAIEQLTRRFDAVVPVDVSVTQLPVSPSQLCDLFIKACKTLDINTRSFMVLFKLFERTVLQALDSLYLAMNNHLEERGILPAKSPQAAQRPPEAQTSGVDGPVETEFLHLDPNLLKSILPRPGVGQSGGHPGGSASASPTDEGPRAHGQPGAVLNRNSTGKAQARPVNTYESTVANILTALTSRQDIATPFIPLLQQLQQPITRIARSDKTFFNNHDHAARRLLNALSTSALAFDKSVVDPIEDDPLFAKIKAVIAKLQSSAYSEPKAIAALTKEFEQFVQQENRRADLYEKRMLDAEEGKHKAQTARQEVLKTIAEITQGLELRSSVNEIINKAWYQVMFVTALKHGTDSRQWDHASQTLIDLVTSTQPYVNHAERVHGLHALQDLKARIRAGLESLFFDEFEVDNTIKKLEDTIHQLAKEKPVANTPKPTVATAAQQASVTVATPPPKVTIEDAFIAQAKNLGRGSWFDLNTDSGPTRCRLAAIIGRYEKYIFVQRNGSKLAEHSLTEVARALASQSLVPLDSNRIFDQALEQVIAGMRK